MAISSSAFAYKGRPDERVERREISILEKQLLQTLELQWHVHQVQLRSIGSTNMKTRVLFAGVAEELRTFVQMIRKRLDSWTRHQSNDVQTSSSYWRLFPVDSVEPGEQLESLLCGYAHYLKRTVEAMRGLRLAGDTESVELLESISKAVERTLWFLEIYFEGLALKTDCSRLPEWHGNYHL